MINKTFRNTYWLKQIKACLILTDFEKICKGYLGQVFIQKKFKEI